MSGTGQQRTAAHLAVVHEDAVDGRLLDQQFPLLRLVRQRHLAAKEVEASEIKRTLCVMGSVSASLCRLSDAVPQAAVIRHAMYSGCHQRGIRVHLLQQLRQDFGARW